MAKNQNPKKENPLLLGIILLVSGIILCFAGKSRDLMLFHVIRLDGEIAFPIIGCLCALFGIIAIVDFIKKKKNQ